MRPRILLFLAILTTLLLGGHAPSPIQQGTFQRDLDALTKRGFTYRMLDYDLIELTDPLSGEKLLKSLREPSEAQIRSWAAQRGIPILEIDPNTIDTSQYKGWYNYRTTVLLGNTAGIPLVVGDLDHNGQADVYGSYKDSLSSEVLESRIYEVDSVGSVHLRHRYIPWPGASRLISDADADSMMEVDCSYNGIISGYEQHSQDSLPIYRSFTHDRYYHNSSVGPSQIYIGNLDGDNLSDFLYQGTGPDPKDTNVAIPKTYVAEFDQVLQNFVRVWSIQFIPGSGAAGFSVGDFDDDGSAEFAATHGGSGRVFVAENAGDNQYAFTWKDSTPFVNFYYHGSGDVDNDGKIEFFTGATMSNGNWVLMYEADSNNAYSAKLLFHLLSGGVFADPIYKSVDIDGDGKLELAMMVGSDLFVFKSNVDDEYYLWYFRRENKMEAIAFHDFNHDGWTDFIASKSDISSQGQLWFYADVYNATSLVSVSEMPPTLWEPTLIQNYPNPFNPLTTITYDIPEDALVSLKIFDVLGREVVTLESARKVAGSYVAKFDATFLSSGLYMYRLQAGTHTMTRKMLLLK